MRRRGQTITSVKSASNFFFFFLSVKIRKKSRFQKKQDSIKTIVKAYKILWNDIIDLCFSFWVEKFLKHKFLLGLKNNSEMLKIVPPISCQIVSAGSPWGQPSMIRQNCCSYAFCFSLICNGQVSWLTPAAPSLLAFLHLFTSRRMF